MMDKLPTLEETCRYDDQGQLMESEYVDDIDDLLQQITAGDSGNGSSSDEVITAVEYVKEELDSPQSTTCSHSSSPDQSGFHTYDHLTHIQPDGHLVPETGADIKIESPPLTPQMDRPPHSPLMYVDHYNNTVINKQPIKVERISTSSAPIVFDQSSMVYHPAPIRCVQSNMALQNGGDPPTRSMIFNHSPEGLIHGYNAGSVLDHSVTTQITASSHHIVSGNINHMDNQRRNITVNEMRIMKKQQRMIKNRESATLSRKRKKEYVEHLESVVQKLTADNDKLRSENAKFQSMILVLQNQIQMFCKRSNLSNKSKTVILVFFAFFALSISPFNSIFKSSVDNRQFEISQWTASGSGRTLLSKNEVIPEETEKSKQNWDSWDRNINSFYEAIFGSKHSTFYDETSLLCPAMNRSESDRVSEDLNGWVQRYEGQRKSKKTRLRESVKKSRSHSEKNIKKQRSRTQDAKKQPNTSDIPTGSDLLLYNNWEDWFLKFMNYFNRREDTFYIVSFDKDHVLLPALTHNRWQRPRMSLLMPALNINDSSGNMTLDQLSMMQIDCEVYNTHFVQWQQLDNSSDYSGEEGRKNESFWNSENSAQDLKTNTQNVELGETDKAHIWSRPKFNFMDLQFDTHPPPLDQRSDDVSNSQHDELDLKFFKKENENKKNFQEKLGAFFEPVNVPVNEPVTNNLILKREITISTNKKERGKMISKQQQNDLKPATSSRLRFYYGKNSISKDTTTDSNTE